MKAITLTQPWATLVAIGAKRIETRSWRTNHRGPLAIHAAKGFPQAAQHLCFNEPFRSYLGNYVKLGEMYLGNHSFPVGCIVATCNLIACIRILAQPVHISSGLLAGIVLPPGEPELSFGDYAPGRYAWILDDVKPLADQIPAMGSLGLWKWNERAE